MTPPGIMGTAVKAAIIPDSLLLSALSGPCFAFPLLALCYTYNLTRV